MDFDLSLSATTVSCCVLAPLGVLVEGDDMLPAIPVTVTSLEVVNDVVVLAFDVELAEVGETASDEEANMY